MTAVAALCVGPWAPGASAQIEATKTDTLLVDADGDGKPSPGDTLRYTISVSNTGVLEGGLIQLIDEVDSRSLIVVSDSITVLPIAVDDTYATTSGVQLVVSPPGVLANDHDPDLSPNLISVGFADTTSVGGGTVSVSTDGGFTYEPAPGFVGPDSFSYELTDGIGVDTATVSIAVVALADVGVTINDDIDPASIDDVVTYTVLVVNHGTATALDVVVTNTLPASVSIGMLSSSQGSCVPDGQRLICNLGSIAASSTATITIQVTPTVPGIPITAAVSVVTSTFDTNLANNSASEETAISVGSPPTATNDAYDATGNVGLNVPEGSGVLANDADPDMDSLTVTSFDSFSAQSGTVSVATNGAFTYTPPAGYTGADGFTYVVSDGGFTDTGTVSVIVSNMIWFLDNTAATGGDGTLAAPYPTMSEFFIGPADAAGDVIFVYRGNGTIAGLNSGISLKNNQRLLGQEVALDTASTGITFPPHTPPLPGVAGRPTFGNGAGVGITLASGNIIRGLNIEATEGPGIFGTSVGTLTLDSVSVSATNGPGVDINGGAVAVTLDSLSSISSGAQGIRLANLSGTFTANGGSLSGASGNAVDINGGSATITYVGSISNTVGRSVSISDTSGSTVTLSGSIHDAGDGLQLSGNGAGSIINISGTNKTLNVGNNTAVDVVNNGGATINFSGGGLDIDASGIGINFIGDNLVNLSDGSNTVTTTANGTGLKATSGGTVELTGDLQILSVDTGRAIDIQNTTIGVSGVTVQSASAQANPGIVLNTTGTTGGGLHVTGTGTADTGGVISGSTTAGLTGNGVDLTSTANVVLEQMRFENANDAAISIQSVTHFKLLNSVLHDRNTSPADASEAGILINGLFGQSLIEDVQFTGINADGIEVVSTTADDGTADELTLRRVSFAGHHPANGEHGIDYRPAGSSNTRLLLDDCTFTINANGIIAALLSPGGSSSADIVVRNCDVNGAAASGSGGIEMHTFDSSSAKYLIEKIQFADNNFFPLAVLSEGSSVMNATVRSNEFNNVTDFDTDSAIVVRQRGESLAIVELSDNTINARTGDRVIEALAHNATIAIGSLDISITGNTFAEPDSENRASGMILRSGASGATGHLNRLRAKIEGNTGEVTGGFAGGFFDFGEGVGIAEGQDTTFELEQGSSSSSDPVVVLGDNNPNIMFSPMPGGADLFVHDTSDGSVAVVPNGTVSTPGLPSEPSL